MADLIDALPDRPAAHMHPDDEGLLWRIEDADEFTRASVAAARAPLLAEVERLKTHAVTLANTERELCIAELESLRSERDSARAALRYLEERLRPCSALGLTAEEAYSSAYQNETAAAIGATENKPAESAQAPACTAQQPVGS